MIRKSIKPISLVLFGLSAILFSIAIVTNTIIETPWKDLKSLQPDGICEYDQNEKAMRLVGYYYFKYAFDLTGKDGSPLVNEDQIKYVPYLIFDMKLDKEKGKQCLILVNLKTSIGDLLLRYDISSQNSGRYYFYQGWYGLGEGIADGEWHTICRDLKKDVKELFPLAQIVEVEKISFRMVGENFVKDIRFSKVLPEGINITKPDTYKSIAHYIWDESAILKLWGRIDFYNQFGEQIKYRIEEYKYENKTLKRLYNYLHKPDGRLINMSTVDYINGEKERIYKNFDSEYRLIAESHVFYQSKPKYEIKTFSTYYNPDGEIWYKSELYSNWNRMEDGEQEITYLDSAGNTIRKRYEEYKFDGGLKYSYHEDKDRNGTILSEEDRFYNPAISNNKEIWSEKRSYENGKLVKITRARDLDYSGGKTYARLEVDYNINNSIEEVRTIYSSYNDEDKLVGKKILHWDSLFEPGLLDEEILDPVYSSALNIPELSKKAIIGVSTKKPASNILDNDMQLNGIEPHWKKEINEIGKLPFCKKSKADIDGRSAKVLRIEHISDAEDDSPVSVSQHIPIKGGNYELDLRYRRWTGKAIIRIEWLPIDLFTEGNLNPILLNEFKDDYREGIQKTGIQFETPNGPGLLLIKLGAASTVDYINMDIKPDIKPYEPQPPKVGSGGGGGPWIDHGKKPDEPKPTENPVELKPSQGGVTNITYINEQASQGKFEQASQEKPVSNVSYIPYIVYKDREKEKKTSDATQEIKPQPSKEIHHIRIYRGDEIWGETGKGLVEKEVVVFGQEDTQPQVQASYDSNQIDNWQTVGLDNGLNSQIDKKLHNFLRVTEDSTVAPNSIMNKKREEPKGVKYYIGGLISLITDRIKEFLTRFGR